MIGYMRRMAQFPVDTIDLDDLSDGEVRYSFCSLVTNPAQYADMVASFRKRGFSGDDCEFIYADNSGGNRHDGYSGINTLINKARGKYIVVIHQDCLAIDDRARLDAALAELDAADPNWALAGNAGGTAKCKAARRMTSSIGFDERIGDLPARVETLDENLIILRKEANLGPSRDLSGFHLYGTDLVQQAAFRGWSAYVVDFHIEHLGLTEIDQDFLASIDAFRAKYRRAVRPKLLSTAVTYVPFGRDFAKSTRHRKRLGHQAAGTKPRFDLKAFRRRLSDARYHRRDDKRGARYTLDGTTFQLPPRSPVPALKAILTGSYESPERELSKKWLPPDLPVVELGGSYGIVSHTLRKHLNDDARLIILEANPDLIDICRNNVEQAGADNTEVVQAALAYGQDTVRFTVTSGLHTSHVATSDGTTDEGNDREIEVPAMTLAGLLADKGIDGDYGLVCDIEGGEFDLFLNDVEALSRCAVAIVELHPDPFVRRGESTSAFLESVRAAGFEVVEVMANVIAARRIA